MKLNPPEIRVTSLTEVLGRYTTARSRVPPGFEPGLSSFEEEVRLICAPGGC